uniref:Phosphatidylcholine transfer protein n=1 Tax=Latimeria chalumnae TaxID=7897 RepID=H3ASM8_LATCH|nr:PREDICTED: phosphatidylcholine transfer protein [Latimeria chalumnae]|eukprot:XP_005999991.1 PREDICTED: phosphatidylcholine transfer protein [Latimeria chalumnae]
MALQFEEQQFQEAWQELDEPRLEGGWEFFTETTGVKIYRLYQKQSGLYEYKVFGGLAGCTPELCADVYMDLDYRKEWDNYVKALYEKDYDGQKVIYWEVRYPFPMSNRDYIYVRDRQDLDINGRKIWVVLAKSISCSQCPEQSGVIRVNEYTQSLVLESDGDKGTKVYMYYFDNPGGMIPSWLINWAAKSGVPSFLTDMQKACRDYSKYCKKKQG